MRKAYVVMAVLAAVLGFAGYAQAQDESKEAPVEPAATMVAPPESVSVPDTTPPAAAIIVPEETKGPRDAITGKRVDDANNPTVDEEEEKSLRDKVRSKMDH